jgi:hypothetical protein
VLAESLKHLKNREETILQIQKLAKETETDFILFKNEQLSSSREFYISSLNLNQKGLKIFNDTLANYLSAELIKLN